MREILDFIILVTFFLDEHKLPNNYILNMRPARGKRFFVSDRGENYPCTYRLVALFQWSKYKTSIFDHFSATKMAPPGGDIKFVFGRSNSEFPTLSHAKKKSSGSHIFDIIF